MQESLPLKKIQKWFSQKSYQSIVDYHLALSDVSALSAASWHLIALAYLFTEQAEESWPCFEAAIEQDQFSVQIQGNYGEALRRAGQLEQAEQQLIKTLSLDPDYQQAAYNLACVWLKQNKLPAAQKQFQSLLKANDTKPEYLAGLADVFRHKNQFDRALKYYKQTLDIAPEHVHAMTNLGRLLLDRGQLEEALSYCQQAIEMGPENIQAYINLGKCYVELEQLEEAMDVLADAYELDPQHPQLLCQIAQNWLAVSNQEQAAYWFKQALEVDDELVQAQTGLAETYKEADLLDQALESVNEIVSRHPDAHQAYFVRAQVYLELGQGESAIADYKKVIDLKPNIAHFHANLGRAYENLGKLDQAENSFRAALAINPKSVAALNGLAMTQKGKLLPADVEMLLKLSENPLFRDGALASIHSGLGYFYDGSKQFDQAARHIEKANQHYWTSKVAKGWEYCPDQYEEHISQLIAFFDKAYFESRQSLGHPSETPVFIVGMPRSGTTLTEQILASHSQVLGVGERPFMNQSFLSLPSFTHQPDVTPIQALMSISATELQEMGDRYLSELKVLQERSQALDVQRIVDKMPDNYSQIAWILSLFPNARIIHARRELRDVAVSCWMTQFSKIRWAFNQAHLADRMIQYDRIMKHWKQVIPERFIETDYEAMVDDPETQSKRLIDYLGLEWEENCLNYYQQDSIVRTASVTQVRQPIYKRSVDRWLRYKDVLSPVFSQLDQAGI